jgi:hypothetical protein
VGVQWDRTHFTLDNADNDVRVTLSFERIKNISNCNCNLFALVFFNSSHFYYIKDQMLFCPSHVSVFIK